MKVEIGKVYNVTDNAMNIFDREVSTGNRQTGCCVICGKKTDTGKKYETSTDMIALEESHIDWEEYATGAITVLVGNDCIKKIIESEV